MLKIISLGGAEVNRNMEIYETEKDIIIIDCGLGFPDDDMPGIDVVIPDITYLKDKKNKIRALFLTHGHEDHRGSLPYILPQLPKIPVYGTKLTLGLSKNKTDEAGLNVDYREVDYKTTITAGDFKVDFVHVNHSIPDAAQLIIHTPEGVIYHGSDYKFDWTPVDDTPADVQKMAKAGSAGVLLMLADCLRVEKPGYTPSEQKVEETFDQQIQKCNGKFIVTTTSSSISRIQQAVNVAIKYNRKIVFAGRSIENNVEVAIRLGFLNIPKNSVIRADEVTRYPAKEIMVLATGALGQDHSALVRMAQGDHKIKITRGDFVTFSQDPIPGSENSVTSLINALIKAGADVYYTGVLDDLHVSGHESAEGLKLMLNLVKPKYVLPFGAELRQIHQYQKMVKTMGYQDDQIICPEEGRVVEIANGKVKLGGKVEVKNIFVDGLGVGDIGNVVLRDRLTMAEDGIVMVIVPMEKNTGEVSGNVDIVSRGFVYMKESDQLIGEAKQVVKAALDEHKGQSDFRFIRRQISDNLEKFLFEATHRRPMILPVIVEV